MNEYNYVTNNGLFYFSEFQNAPVNSSLYQRGLAFSDENSLDGFYAAAANGTLPEVSWIFPPGAVNGELLLFQYLVSGCRTSEGAPRENNSGFKYWPNHNRRELFC